MTAKTMRNLNRIIFINSANIPYADDIYLDGNVHFIGTQGVGKSTALRALLFFYNADKTKLGISKEKKSFDENLQTDLMVETDKNRYYFVVESTYTDYNRLVKFMYPQRDFEKNQ